MYIQDLSISDAQINVGAVSPSELRAVSEKSLLLLAGIVANVEVGPFWPAFWGTKNRMPVLRHLTFNSSSQTFSFAYNPGSE